MGARRIFEHDRAGARGLIGFILQPLPPPHRPIAFWVSRLKRARTPARACFVIQVTRAPFNLSALLVGLGRRGWN